MQDYPNTPQQQAILQAVVAFYQDDRRLLAVCLVGPLGGDAGQATAGLNLDIVLAAGVTVEPLAELAALCASFVGLGEQAAIIVATGLDSGGVVLASLLELAVRYHPLASSSPAVAHYGLVLAGSLTIAQLQAAGAANQQADEPLGQMLNRCLRYAVAVDTAAERGDLWRGVELLHQMRGLLLAIAARTQGQARPATDRLAAALHDRLGATLPLYSAASLRHCLATFLDLLEYDLRSWSNGQLLLDDAQNGVLQAIRERAGYA